MPIKTKSSAKPYGWITLFMPEDTANGGIVDPGIRQQDGVMGCIKCWLWILVSIAMALAIGRL